MISNYYKQLVSAACLKNDESLEQMDLNGLWGIARIKGEL